MTGTKPMLASDLVYALAEAIREHGDIPVRIWDKEIDYALPFVLERAPAKVQCKYPEIWPSLVLRVVVRGVVRDEPSREPLK